MCTGETGHARQCRPDRGREGPVAPSSAGPERQQGGRGRWEKAAAARRDAVAGVRATRGPDVV